jgi:sterol 3beta-glucosyltransferase
VRPLTILASQVRTLMPRLAALCSMISGYWFMPGGETEWTPPDELDAFMKKARADGKPLVYIGFGSIVVPHPAETTRAIIRAVERAGVRAIVAKGWSGRGNEVDKDGLPIEVPFPESCHSLEKVPHDWLFNRIDAAVHHGGAGTTGASLRAGLPTIIKPWVRRRAPSPLAKALC